jgi:hypothetical protein
MTTHTLKDVATLEAEVAQVQGDLHAARATAAEAAHHARQNPRDKAAIAQRIEAAATLEAYEGHLTDLESTLTATREVEATATAERRLLGVKRAFSSLLSEDDPDVQRILEAAQSLAHAIERRDQRYSRLTSLWLEGLTLAERFALEPPDLPKPSRPSVDQRVIDVLVRVRTIAPATARAVPLGLAALPYSSGTGWSVERALTTIASTPTADLLKQAGLGILGESAAWEARRQEEQNRSRNRGDAARVARVAQC